MRGLRDFFRSGTRESGKVRTDLWCHDCRNDFSVDLDYDLSGNHIVNCPHCGHEHCRVISDGVVTSDRWDSRNGASGAVITYAPYQVYTTSTSTTTATYFLASSWAATGT